MSTEQILIAGIVALWTTLIAVVGGLWAFVLHPIVKKMLELIETIQEEQPAQTDQLKLQTSYLKAAKHSSAEHLKLQRDEMVLLNDLKESKSCKYRPGEK